jgi:menaquinone-dependent protoporphyrinogen oxidase
MAHLLLLGARNRLGSRDSEEEQAMKVLVAIASRHDATRGIAEVIADELVTSGLEVDLRDADAVEDIADYQAAVVGSAVYTGGWLAEARHLVDFNGPALRKVPVWLFSSGPIGTDDTKTLDDLPEVQELMKATGAREHRVFAGRLDKRNLDVAERLVSKVVDAPEGDFRDLGAIIEWAGSIASSLARVHPQHEEENS